MDNAEILLRTILGPVRCSIRPLVLAVDVTSQLLFLQHFSMDDIHVTKLVYPAVAELIPCKSDTAARRIERLVHLCWDALVGQNLVRYYLGRDLPYSPAPLSLLVYLAVYANLNTPFFDAIELYPHLLFPPSSSPQPPPSPPTAMIADALLRSQPLSVSKKIIFSSSAGTTSFPLCPHCSISLDREFQNFCDRCGQRLAWNYFHRAQPLLPGSSEICT